ncbi:MAG TPA: SRPBCC family protein [Caulobacteraceae bacterium]
MRAAPLAAAAIALALGGAARCEVVDSQPGGFTVRHTLDIAAPPSRVWEALGHIGAWWNPEHTFSGDAKNLSIELKAGGCWCESFPGGGVVGHMIVVYVQPGRTLRAFGALGPLQALGAAGAMTWSLQPQAGHTLLTWTYDVGGHAPGGLGALAAPVDTVLGEQAGRLKSYVEGGRP